MGAPRILVDVKERHPNWKLSEKRLKRLRAQGLADGRLSQPKHEIGRQLKPSPDTAGGAGRLTLLKRNGDLRKSGSSWTRSKSLLASLYGVICHMLSRVLSTPSATTISPSRNPVLRLAALS
ncbi:hypothetical protein BOTBODRAFT_38833 [Botryobasidium botryosum FD-172 SS1]|uniref:Uncharacterized protein n=1 Tax=Botryobasidium botryosum (strain FD-172 SS1) TaxID=930990 RepID=A0A067LW91_BOTB1|nr:hypothetical protein BOTBODRAFT_38833 [Botryobasidium botryosum FD-172 SS1]